MAWAGVGRKPAGNGAAVGGLDINASQARAVFGGSGVPPRPALLADPREELPLAIGLDTRTPHVDAGSLAFRRAAPHQLCAGFLPFLGQPRTWVNNRHRLDAAAAFGHVAERLRNGLAGVAGLAVTLPAYLTSAQVQLVRSALESAKLPLLSSASLPLALSAHHAESTRAIAMVVDADDFAATCTVVVGEGKLFRLLATSSLSNFGVRGWVDRLMEFVADRCVHLCRRDPRDSAAAEQALDDQLSAVVSNTRSGQPLAVNVRTEHWYQNLVFQADELEKACASHARTVAEVAKQALLKAEVSGSPDVVYFTATAARLPGLVPTMGLRLPERTVLRELSPMAPAEAAHALAVRRLNGDLPPGHLDGALPRAANAGGQERLTVR